jgi:hypothetical protein
MSCRLNGFWPFMLICFFLTACSSDPTPVKVSGSVSVDGKPLADGAIYFSSPGNTPDTLPIANGQFEGKVKPGEKHVEIVGYGKSDAPPVPAKGEQPPVPEVKSNYLPSRYNEQSKLKATVSASGVEPSKFELKSK